MFILLFVVVLTGVVVTNESAGSKVAAIPELLERILLFAPLKTTLLSQRVSWEWNTVIAELPQAIESFVLRRRTQQQYERPDRTDMVGAMSTRVR